MSRNLLVDARAQAGQALEEIDITVKRFGLEHPVDSMCGDPSKHFECMLLCFFVIATNIWRRPELRYAW
jgi:hypothetical protein